MLTRWDGSGDALGLITNLFKDNIVTPISTNDGNKTLLKNIVYETLMLCYTAIEEIRAYLSKILIELGKMDAILINETPGNIQITIRQQLNDNLITPLTDAYTALKTIYNENIQRINISLDDKLPPAKEIITDPGAIAAAAQAAQAAAAAALATQIEEETAQAAAAATVATHTSATSASKVEPAIVVVVVEATDSDVDPGAAAGVPETAAVVPGAVAEPKLHADITGRIVSALDDIFENFPVDAMDQSPELREKLTTAFTQSLSSDRDTLDDSLATVIADVATSSEVIQLWWGSIYVALQAAYTDMISEPEPYTADGGFRFNPKLITIDQNGGFTFNPKLITIDQNGGFIFNPKLVDIK